MVVEFLTFTVAESELAEWLEIEQRHWSRFLEQQDGFVRKEMWKGDGEQVHAVIWWASLEQWMVIPQSELDKVAEAMGPYEREASCKVYDVLRES